MEEPFDGHERDEEGEHDPDACYSCLLGAEATFSCRCGKCCRLLIEVLPQDAEREPRIRELGSPILSAAEFSPGGTRELEGYVLNSPDTGACVFLDERANLCTVYETRPLVCRLFDCDGEGRQQLVDLGILPPRNN